MDSRSPSPSFSTSRSPTPSKGHCICERPPVAVICSLCGYWNTGRLRRSCPDHPNVVLLMDFELCPNCRTYHGMVEAAVPGSLRKSPTPSQQEPLPSPRNPPEPLRKPIF